MSPWVMAAIFGVVAAGIGYWLMFKDLDDLLECIKCWLMPDIVSIFRGEFVEDWWAEIRLLVFLVFIGLFVWYGYRFGKRLQDEAPAKPAVSLLRVNAGGTP